MKILLIEDNASNRAVAQTLLEALGHEVLWAERAEEGLSLCQREQPGLVLMDIQLPGMDGLEATRILRADPRCAHIPVVALTAYAMESDRKAALEAGCDDYLAKPYKLDQLEEKIKKFL